jgi:hypothetical protein
MSRPTRALAAVVISGIVLGLTGCVGAHPAHPSTPASGGNVQAINNYWIAMDLVQEAQDVLGGSWEHQDAGAEQCQLASGGLGAQVTLFRLGDGVPVDHQQTTLDELQKRWRTAGLDAVQSTLGTLNGITPVVLSYPASGVTADGFYIEVSLSTAGSTIEVRSSCGAGDADKLNEQRQWRTQSPSPEPSSAAPGDDT